MNFSRLRRLWHIHRVMRRYGLMEFVPGRVPTLRSPRGERLRLALEELGPVFVKLGQALSTRPDILPPDVAVELSKLQDQVPPFPGEVARAEVERALGKPVGELFDAFDLRPLASASVAQVHTARLKPEAGSNGPGLDVIVKVLRPDIETIIRRDVQLMHTIAAYVERWLPETRRLKPREVVVEYENVIFDELDLMREGANCAQLRRNWIGSDFIYHPMVFWDYTRPSVLVLERVYGINVDEIARLRELGVDFRVLSERGVEIFFKQVFRDNFFHADMHPGNILVDATDPKKPRYNAVDFGIVGSLTASDQRYLAENFLAFFNRDYRRIAELHVQSGWVPADTRVEDFESAIRTVSEPIFGKPIKDISFGFFLMRLFQIARRFHMPVQPQLVLLQKTLLQVEGLGRQLYPELDLWQTAKPIMEEWMRNRLGPGAAIDRVRNQLPALMETLPELAQRALARLQHPHHAAAWQRRESDALRREIRNGQRRNGALIVGGVLLLAAAILHGLDGYRPVVYGFRFFNLDISASLPTWLLASLGLLAWWRGSRPEK
ncbi:MAG TPA: ubiquinone biosynthesis regulatory protein kinase UbiB [Verrucomicrobiae bacterium]|nr:ubiquinone biosynthesis regulatory protein kinase UbiB [Verrucomicrobiae bacterium]